MKKIVKKIFLSLLIALLVLFLLFIVYLIVSFHEQGKLMESFRNYAPFICQNSRWVCQEVELYFIMGESRCGNGAGTIAGEAVFFQIFPDNYVPGVVVDSRHIEDSGDRYITTLLTGRGCYEEDRFTLTYNAGRYPVSWGGTEGDVTLTFLRDRQYQPFDLDRDGANSKWTCIGRDVWFLSDGDGALSGESLVNGEAVPFRLCFDQQQGDFLAEFIQPDENGEPAVCAQITGAVWYDRERCVLQYNAAQDENGLWGPETGGTVTLTFLREDLPDPADPSGDA